MTSYFSNVNYQNPYANNIYGTNTSTNNQAPYGYYTNGYYPQNSSYNGIFGYGFNNNNYNFNNTHNYLMGNSSATTGDMYVAKALKRLFGLSSEIAEAQGNSNTNESGNTEGAGGASDPEASSGASAPKELDGETKEQAKFDVRTKFTGTAEELNKHLSGKLAGKGAKLLELQEKYGINAAFLAAVANFESGHGTSDAANNKNNVTGTMTNGGKDVKTFASIDECLEYTAQNLHDNYISKGKYTIADIQKTYCPVGADNDKNGTNKDWLTGVAGLTAKYNKIT